MQIKCVHFGAYYHGDNDIVYLMADNLTRTFPTVCIDLHLYDKTKKLYVREDFTYHPKSTFSIKYIAHSLVVEAIRRHNPEYVITNAGGITFGDETFDFLKQKGIKTIGISLSDPDVYQYHGYRYAKKYDFYFTNSEYSCREQYGAIKAYLLSFAASPSLHFPTPKVKKIYDVVVVGEYRKDRKATVDALMKNFNVGLYGSGWGSRIKSVEGKAHREAINSGKIYLSFSKTAAGFMNVKIGLFEAAACKMVLITQDFPEVESYFKRGKEIILYGSNNIHYLIKYVREILDNQDISEKLAENSYRRCLREHTWERRWRYVFNICDQP